MIRNQVTKKFPEESQTALAIFKAESGLNPTAQGYNCYYGSSSRACDIEDRAKAWSVDCGIAQINFPGLSSCPDYSFDVNYSLERARQKYDGRGQTWGAWSVYKSGSYKRYL